ncbi:quinone-dependent dihydroorotate dehydrogenase [archaeon]|jgi:dihydroorotate dehydrogenase|nr:quinone-dependent dihydroorotate dehydrogenase [archaeon]
MYKKFIKPILFKFNPEFVHDTINLTARFASVTRTSRILRPLFVYKNEKLENQILNINFKNPIGLAAGFDKNAQLTNFMPDLGFGFMEVGSITSNPCEGNPKPRLHRLVKGKGIIVNYGLTNNGAENITKKLKNKKFRIPIGISIAKTNDSSIKGDASIQDYFKSFQLAKDIADYITINISCPNVGDGRSFEDPELLEKLLKKIKTKQTNKPIFLKLSPDIKKDNLNKIIQLAENYNIDGFIASNLTKDRTNIDLEGKGKFKGGISGKPTQDKSNQLIKYIYKKTNGKFIIIGCGGVFNGKDAYEKIKAGASLIQIVTGLIFEGPSILKKINKELVELLEKDNYKNIQDAVGKGN